MKTYLHFLTKIVLVCALLSAPFAIAEHQLSHITQDHIAEHCELCSHGNNITFSLSDNSPYVDSINFSSIDNFSDFDSLEKNTYTHFNSRAPPQHPQI